MSRIASVCRHECQGAHLITAAEVEASGTQTHHTARHDDAGSSNASDDVQCGWGRLILQEQTFRNLRSGDSTPPFKPRHPASTFLQCRLCIIGTDLTITVYRAQAGAQGLTCSGVPFTATSALMGTDSGCSGRVAS